MQIGGEDVYSTKRTPESRRLPVPITSFQNVKDMRVGRRGQRRGEVRVMVMISRDSLVRRIQIAELDYKVES